MQGEIHYSPKQFEKHLYAYQKWILSKLKRKCLQSLQESISNAADVNNHACLNNAAIGINDCTALIKFFKLGQTPIQLLKKEAKDMSADALLDLVVHLQTDLFFRYKLKLLKSLIGKIDNEAMLIIMKSEFKIWIRGFLYRQ